MLVLGRKKGERIVIGHDIVVTVLETCGNRVRLGIAAPQAISINRAEVQEKLARASNGVAAHGVHDRTPFFVEID
jgi:carbon storage regulator